jgi:disulfide bond formation protein DsbB
MRPVLKKPIALVLLLSLLALGGVMTAQSVEHAAHHAHHQATMHASALCAWMCAAGQALETNTIVFHGHLALVDGWLALPVEAPATLLLEITATRGPPVSV